MKLSYEQMIIGLDKLMFQGDLRSLKDAEERMETIEAYIASTGWTWQLITDYMSEESSKDSN